MSALPPQVDWPASEQLADLVAADLGMCARNVGRAFVRHMASLPQESTYVEGIWMVGGQPGLHAWIEADRRIIDPTMVRLSPGLIREGVSHHGILWLSADEATQRYQHLPLDSDDRLDLILDWRDPRVERLVHGVDPP